MTSQFCSIKGVIKSWKNGFQGGVPSEEDYLVSPTLLASGNGTESMFRSNHGLDLEMEKRAECQRQENDPSHSLVIQSH